MTAAKDPLVTFALGTFNQASYVREAIRAAFAQDYSPLEIIISDDASTDDTFLIIEEEAAAYKGPHRIRLNRNRENLGVGNHLNLIFGMAQANLIVMAAGDDVSLPVRTRVLADAYRLAGEEYFYASSNADTIDCDGRVTSVSFLRGRPPDDLIGLVNGSRMPLGATSCCTRTLLHQFGGLSRNLMNEDFVLPLRAHLLGSVAYVDRSLVKYRIGAGSMSQANRLIGREELMVQRVRYLARQQIAVACMLEDLCFFASREQPYPRSLNVERAKRILCKRLADLAAVESSCGYRSAGRRFRAALELLRAPRALVAMLANAMRHWRA